MTIRMMKWPDGRIPELKLERPLPAGYGDVAWKRTLTDASLGAFVDKLARLIGAPITPVDVLFVRMNVMTEDVIRTTHRGVNLDLDHERWIAANVVVGWIVEHAPQTLRDVLVDLPAGDAWEIHAALYFRFCKWRHTSWLPLQNECLARLGAWRAMPREEGLAAGEAFYASPHGALVLTDIVLRGRAGLDHTKRIGVTFDGVVERLVGRPTDDDRQEILAAIFERNRQGRPIGWYLAEDGRRLMLDHRGLRQLVVKTLGLRYVTVKSPDGTKRRVYRRRAEPTPVDVRDRDGNRSIDQVRAKPLKAEHLRQRRENIEEWRAFRRDIEDDRVVQAEYFNRVHQMPIAEAARRAGVSTRDVKAARASHRLRKRFERFRDVRQA